MIYLLNTNVLSRLARGCDAGLARRVANNLMNCRLSAIAWFELQYGAARSPHPNKVSRVSSSCETFYPKLFLLTSKRPVGQVKFVCS